MSDETESSGSFSTGGTSTDDGYGGNQGIVAQPPAPAATLVYAAAERDQLNNLTRTVQQMLDALRGANLVS